ncbi:UDP-glucuronosyl/UDP-glucosyltransferase [Parasponia andersonii]|uniref:Glycosyltransferase n=1 Tax=Parasponia andersonii TaxID=3476 RepID=A0A2P5CH09_PARAD|nr:UDP-glucuronosyl/UDP-glucosyltransferase [Parasponia andersonii]
MEDAQSTIKPHAVMIPIHYQGHVTPTINLALKLASKGFTITFVNTENIHHQITKSSLKKQSKESEEDHDIDIDIFAGARNSGLDIRYKTISDGFPLSYDRTRNRAEFNEANLKVFPAHVDELLGHLVQDDPSVSCLITDTFYTWTSRIARKYNLVNISFWTQPALAFISLGPSNTRVDTIDYIPGVKAIEPKDLTSFLQSTNTTSLARRIIDTAFNDVKNADFILINAVQELENDTISAIQEKQPFFAVGPIIPSGVTRGLVPTSLRTESDCNNWLNTKPQGSVLYVSFGSSIRSRKSDIDEIAQGLVLSQVDFIWVLRPDAVSYEEPYVLPDGFEEKTKNKGLVVPWCSQIEVLSHGAVGGFMTHCGWNSVLESLWCGVPLLCFPLLAEQPTNRKLVVDDWRIGVNLCDSKPLTGLEVAEKINRLMSGKSAEDLREQTFKVRQTVERALAAEGLSQKNLNQFISDVKAKIRRVK